jgi:hypothetical protein
MSFGSLSAHAHPNTPIGACSAAHAAQTIASIGHGARFYSPTYASGPTHIPNRPVGAFSAAHAAHAIASTRSSCRPSRHVPNVSFAASVDCHVRRAAADTLVAFVIATSFETGLPQSNAANSDSASPRQPWPGANRSTFHEQSVAAQ